jgi:putative sugar O-methyltransferase
MNTVIEKLIDLRKLNIQTKYLSENMWEGFLNKEPYRNFFKAFQERNCHSLEEILLNYKKHYIVEFSSPETLNVDLLRTYNKEFKTELNTKSPEISNISNIGIDNISKCHLASNNMVVNTLSIRYYFTYLFLNRFLKNKNNINILEIGCCSPVGVMQNFLKYSLEQINCILLCDLFPVLLISYSTLLYNFPNIKILFYNNEKNVEELISHYDVILIIPDYINNFINCKIELCFNSYSFSEMTEYNLKNYFNFLKKTTNYLISENKHTDNNQGFKALLDFIPNSFKTQSTHNNCNVPDGHHNIICFKIYNI